MSLRKKLSQGGPGAAFAAMCIAAAAGLIYLMWPSSGFENVGKNVWVYNLETGELVRMPKKTTFPPVTLDGGTGYEATVFRCAEDGEDEHKIGYLTRYTDEALQALQAQNGEVNESNLWVVLNPARSRLSASVESAKEGNWGPAAMGRNEALLKEAQKACGGDVVMVVP